MQLQGDDLKTPQSRLGSGRSRSISPTSRPSSTSTESIPVRGIDRPDVSSRRKRPGVSSLDGAAHADLARNGPARASRRSLENPPPPGRRAGIHPSEIHTHGYRRRFVRFPRRGGPELEPNPVDRAITHCRHGGFILPHRGRGGRAGVGTASTFGSSPIPRPRAPSPASPRMGEGIGSPDTIWTWHIFNGFDLKPARQKGIRHRDLRRNGQTIALARLGRLRCRDPLQPSRWRARRGRLPKHPRHRPQGRVAGGRVHHRARARHQRRASDVTPRPPPPTPWRGEG